MDWATLFERAPEGVTVEEVREALAERREDDRRESSERASGRERHASRDGER